MQDNSSLVGIISIILIVLIIILVALVVGAAIYMAKRKQGNLGGKGKKLGKTSTTGATHSSKPAKNMNIESMRKFLDFDEIVDSMIVRKNRQQYVMVIQCKGVNFDLLGAEEKIAVENGFTQFLNTLRFPIQLYIQTRSLNLRESVDQYRTKIDEVRQDILKIEASIRREQSNGRMDLVRKLEFEKRRKENILEYGADITDYVSRMSQNRNVLQQNTYVIVSYYTSEFGGTIQNYAKSEIDNMAFSELYTRAQTLIRGLASAGVSGRVIQSEELAELLFIAYNRDEADLLNIRRMVDNEYDSLYNTAKDVMEKQKEMIEAKVNAEAVDLAATSIKKADRVLKFRMEKQKEIKDRATEYVEQYKYEMTPDLYEETKNQIKKADITGEGEKKSSKSSKKDMTEEEKKAYLKERKEKELEAVKALKEKRPLTEEQKKLLIERKKRRLAREAQAKKNAEV